MKKILTLLCFVSMACFFSCSSNTNEKTKDEKTLVEVPATGPSQNESIGELIKNDPPSMISSEKFVGKWMLFDYDIEKYIHTPNMNEKQRNNFKKIIDNIIGKMYFDFSEEGDYRSQSGLPQVYLGKWFIGEDGKNLNMQQEFESNNDVKAVKPKTNVYAIDQFSVNYLTLTDKDHLTYIFKRAE